MLSTDDLTRSSYILDGIVPFKIGVSFLHIYSEKDFEVAKSMLEEYKKIEDILTENEFNEMKRMSLTLEEYKKMHRGKFYLKDFGI